MKYLYYPGCSMKSTGKPYEESLLAVFSALGVQLPELSGWNCCGATYGVAVDEAKGVALAARNLCLAEQQDNQETVQMMAPCTACFLTHTKAQNYMNDYSQLAATVQQGLAAVGLQYRGRVAVRHPLDVLVNDVGLDRIKERISRPLAGMKVACYYGCQLVRPYATFDDRYDPMTMDKLLRAAGAETVDWPLKTRCCGGTLTGIGEEGGQNLSFALLREARKRGANAIATACSLCQLNLECYQDRVKHRFGEDVAIPVAYFTQLLGRAMGIPDQRLGLRRMLVSLEPLAASV